MITWVVLTTGGRPEALQRAVGSLAGARCLVLGNGTDDIALEPSGSIDVLTTDENLGVPGGRDLAARRCTTETVGFLDDDAEATPGVTERVLSAFAADPRLGAVALRLVDESGATARRHVPRFGGRGARQSGEVALFLGGACAVRRDAYDEVGGYFTRLFYGHEEVELCWRLVDRGWRIRYLADAEVFHPRTDIGRHEEGWRMTGRNRVLVARRTLPWPVALVHVVAWLMIGALRAPGRTNRGAYVRGWWSGWSGSIDRRPIAWRSVWRLTRLGRPPLL